MNGLTGRTTLTHNSGRRLCTTVLQAGGPGVPSTACNLRLPQTRHASQVVDAIADANQLRSAREHRPTKGLLDHRLRHKATCKESEIATHSGAYCAYSAALEAFFVYELHAQTVCKGGWWGMRSPAHARRHAHLNNLQLCVNALACTQPVGQRRMEPTPTCPTNRPRGDCWTQEGGQDWAFRSRARPAALGRLSQTSIRCRS